MKYAELISKMTLEEKASLCSGADYWHTKAVGRLGIPAIMVTDGPHGLRKQQAKEDHLGLNGSVPAICYPTAAALANSWDEALIEQMGEHLGLEARAEGISVVLGPGVNIKRSPLCGRNFEYYSEDPLLAGKCAAALIRGLQSKGVAACVKHFAANSQETFRMTNDSVMDERTLREIYLPAFELAVKEGAVRWLMTSYNKLNGEYTNENKHLLQDILRGEWGYKGVIVTDWGGENDRVAGLIAGNQLEMPDSHGETDAEIVQAVRAGRLDESLLDERVDTLLDSVFTLRQSVGASYDRREHHAFARRIAGECAVLLKNEGGILPLKAGARVAVIGDFAKHPRYQGAGSSLINPTELDNGLEQMKRAGLNVTGYEPGFRRFGGRDEKLLQRACKLASEADAAVIWLGLDEGSEAEGLDRENMLLPDNQRALLKAVGGVNDNIVVVLSCGSPVETDWDSDCAALLHGYLGGQAGAGAVADILSGKVCPSGKLAETMPIRLSDVPCSPFYPGREATSEYREGVFVGYRYYCSAKKQVKYPFGFGLSYTQFEYSDPEFDGRTLSFSVKNIGEVTGSEIAEVYVRPKCARVFRPDRELRGFARAELRPGESRRLCVTLGERAFQYWNVLTDRFETEEGDYELLVGASSADIRLALCVHKTGSGAPDPYTDKIFEPYRTARVRGVDKAAFTALLGHEPPERMFDRDAPLDMLSAIAQGAYLKGGAGKALYRTVALARKALLLAGKKLAANNFLYIAALPYRGISRMSGLFTKKQVEALLRFINKTAGREK